MKFDWLTFGKSALVGVIAGLLFYGLNSWGISKIIVSLLIAGGVGYYAYGKYFYKPTETKL